MFSFRSNLLIYLLFLDQSILFFSPTGLQVRHPRRGVLREMPEDRLWGAATLVSGGCRSSFAWGEVVVVVWTLPFLAEMPWNYFLFHGRRWRRYELFLLYIKQRWKRIFLVLGALLTWVTYLVLRSKPSPPFSGSKEIIFLCKISNFTNGSSKEY